MNKIDKNLLENLSQGRFQISILCRECNQPCGLVQGGLSGSPRIYCFNEEEMKDEDELKIEITELSAF